MTEPGSHRDEPENPKEPPDQVPSPPGSIPGPVQAAAILLYVGGAVTLVAALSGLLAGTPAAFLRGAIYAVLGALYLGLARMVQRRRRWARRTVLVLCAIGAAIAAIRLSSGVQSSAAIALAWPLVYAILLSGRAARTWFAGGQTPEPRRS